MSDTQRAADSQVRGWDEYDNIPDPPRPHRTHEPAPNNDFYACLGCGDTDYDLEDPCANARCLKCGELNGLKSPACGEDHGTVYAYGVVKPEPINMPEGQLDLS